MDITVVFVVAIIAFVFGLICCYLLLSNSRNGKIKAEYEQKIVQLKLEHQQAIQLAQKRSVNTSRSVLKGRMAEQFAPMLPEFGYLPSDAKFLGDPIDYVIFDGYSEFREGLLSADDISIVLMDVKSGQARLHKGQHAIANAIAQGRVRFETLHVDFDDDNDWYDDVNERHQKS